MSNLLDVLNADVLHNLMEFDINQNTLFNFLCSSRELTLYAKTNPSLISKWYQNNVSTSLGDELLWNYKRKRESAFWLLMRRITLNTANRYAAGDTRVVLRTYEILSELVQTILFQSIEEDELNTFSIWKSTVIQILISCCYALKNPQIFANIETKPFLVNHQELVKLAIRYSTHFAEAEVVRSLLDFSKCRSNIIEEMKLCKFSSSELNKLITSGYETYIQQLDSKSDAVTFRCNYSWCLKVLRKHKFDILILLIENRMILQNENADISEVQDSKKDWLYMLTSVSIEQNSKAVDFLLNLFYEKSSDDNFPSIEESVMSIYKSCFAYKKMEFIIEITKFSKPEVLYAMELPFRNENFFREIFLIALGHGNEESLKWLINPNINSHFPVTTTLNSSKSLPSSSPWAIWINCLFEKQHQYPEILMPIFETVPLLKQWKLDNPSKKSTVSTTDKWLKKFIRRNQFMN